MAGVLRLGRWVIRGDCWTGHLVSTCFGKKGSRIDVSHDRIQSQI